MLRLTGIVGAAAEPELGERLHELQHRGAVEYLVLEREDTQRHRLRATTEGSAFVHGGDGVLTADCTGRGRPCRLILCTGLRSNLASELSRVYKFSHCRILAEIHGSHVFRKHRFSRRDPGRIAHH